MINARREASYSGYDVPYVAKDSTITPGRIRTMEVIYLTVELSTFTKTEYVSRGYYSHRIDTKVHEFEAYKVTQVEADKATHFIPLYYTSDKFFPEDPYFLGNKESPKSGDIYPLEDLEIVLAFFQKKDEEHNQWKKAEQEKENLKLSLIPVIQSFLDKNKDKGRFEINPSMGTSYIQISVRHITWGDSQSVMVSKLVQEGEPYLEQVLQYLIKRRDDVHACWVKEDRQKALMRSVESIMPEGFSASFGGDWDVYLRKGKHSSKITTIEFLPDIIEKLTLLDKVEENKLNRIKELRASKKPIPKKLSH